MSAPADSSAIKNAVELALLAAGQPLDIRTLKRVLDARIDTAQLRQIIAQLQSDWATRALELVESAGGYQFISRPEYQAHIRRLNPERPARLSRALLEILAIIAYRQPVTRGDIEKIRSIVVSSNQIAFLEEQGWIEEVGHRETPGRPALYATTHVFLDDLGLLSLNDLPQLPDIEEEGSDEETSSGEKDTPANPAAEHEKPE